MGKVKPLHFSEVESNRFDRQVWRGQATTRDALKAVAEQIRSNPIDLAILRISPELLTDTHILQDLSGQLLPADVLVHYSRAATPLTTKGSTSPCSIRPAMNADLPAINQITRGAFSDYATHYHCNPALPNFDLCAAYEEWNAAHLEKDNSGIFLATFQDTPVGFLSWTITNGIMSIDLNGVTPEAQGKQVYSSLLQHTFNESHTNDVKMVTVETQLHNLRVQKVWQRWGLQHDKSFVTFHWNREFT